LRLRILALALALFTVVFVAAYLASTAQGYLDVSELRRVRGGSVNVIGVIEGYSVEGGVLKVSLAGRDGSRVTLEIPVELFISAHGKPPGPWVIGKSIGVRGYYEPSLDKPGYLGVVRVKEILSPCHDSYKAPPART
jgi:hypothetical protein